MSPFRPATPDPLRAFLRDRITDARLQRIASADYNRDRKGIFQELRRNLDTGLYAYAGDGSPLECAVMQRHDTTPNRPLNQLFGAWWIGTFISGAQLGWLIDSIAPSGVDSLLRMVVQGCGELESQAKPAAHAAIPFVKYLRTRTLHASTTSFDPALAALEAVERLGKAGKDTERYLVFIASVDGSSFG